MRRILISLLLGAAILLRITCSKPVEAGKGLPAGKSDPLVFVFLRVDAEQHLAILRPMIAPDIGVQLDYGSRQLEKRAVLQCRSAMREHNALVDGQISKFSEMLLDCGDYKFVVKAIDFSPQR